MLLVKRIEIHDEEIKITLSGHQLPFVNSPDGNQGFLQHKLPGVCKRLGLWPDCNRRERLNTIAGDSRIF